MQEDMQAQRQGGGGPEGRVAMMLSSPRKRSSSSMKRSNSIRHAGTKAGRWGTRGAGGNDAVLTQRKKQQQEGK